MTDDPLSAWTGFLTRPAAPRTAMWPMELDGYLTGIVVGPDVILPSRWLGPVWGKAGPQFDSIEQAQAALGAVMQHYNDLIAAIDDGYKRLEAKQSFDYRPLFQKLDEKPDHATIRTWVDGFGKAMALSPAWESLIRDERIRALISPIVSFMEIDGECVIRAENIDEVLDEAAAEIPRIVIVLRKLFQPGNARTGGKPGRNETCPCGSGRKYKRC
ncbi:MAG TPA: UPF0149 family protein, partial [Rhizomicrobium sp.]|nr:UPF0149 family protein [Rhizomicrobium sp.]